MKYPLLSEDQDKRRKIPTSEHEYIRRLYEKEGHSQRELSRLYGVSRRLIVFILHPERERMQKERVKEEKRWNRYYNKDKQREYMRTHRKNKHALQHDEVRKHANEKRRGICPHCLKSRTDVSRHIRLYCKQKPL